MVSRSNLLAAALLVCAVLLPDLVHGIRIYKSRKNAMKTLGGVTVDTQQYIGSCEQSSNTESCVLAMDNEFSQEWTQCAVTEQSQVSFWRGFLENPLYVTSVYILNAEWKGVGFRDGLLEFTIGGSSQTCYTHKGEKSFNSKTFPCDIMASEIQIKSSLADAVLAICDVQVFGAVLKFPTIQTSVRKLHFDDCGHSSTQKSMQCWFATDDFKSTRANEGHCAMTNPGVAEWWKGFLDVPALVQEVILLTRDDCCPEDLTNFIIFVSGSKCARYNDPKPIKGATGFSCNLFGNEVMIQQLNNNKPLTLCDVQAFGHQLEMLDEQKRTVLGCFLDKQDDPDMAEFNNMGPVSLTTMHTGKCDRICRRLKAKYFGLQAGSECWCGNSYGKHGPVNTTECGIQCEGKPSSPLQRSQSDNIAKYCGGLDRKIVYQLN